MREEMNRLHTVIYENNLELSQYKNTVFEQQNPFAFLGDCNCGRSPLGELREAIQRMTKFCGKV